MGRGRGTGKQKENKELATSAKPNLEVESTSVLENYELHNDHNYDPS